MERLSYSSRCALMVELTKKLREAGSWCGETHVQKALYIVQDLSKSNLGYKFVIYKHGPFSFDLKSELAAMHAANIFEMKFPREGYGPSILPTSFGERVYEVNKENVREYVPLTQFVANWFSSKDVRDLEKIATAYFVTAKHPRDRVIERAKRLTSLKPHVDLHSAEEAVLTVDQMREEAKEFVLSKRAA